MLLCSNPDIPPTPLVISFSWSPLAICSAKHVSTLRRVPSKDIDPSAQLINDGPPDIVQWWCVQSRGRPTR